MRNLIFKWLGVSRQIVTVLGIGTMCLSLSLLSTTAVAYGSVCKPPIYASGVHQPVGADAALYTYDCALNLWISKYYSFNPLTGVYAPLYSVTYTYDPSTGNYNYTDWVYSSPDKTYVQQTATTASPPTGAIVIGGPKATVSDSPKSTTNSISNTGSGSSNTINTNSSGASNSISSSGSNSNNTINSNGTPNVLNATNGTTAVIGNNVTSVATSGGATVLANTTGGGASSGNTTDTANIVNMLQSASNALGGNAVTFVANINGNVNGNFLLDPSTISSVQSSPAPNNITLNNTDNASMTNNINLSADSGNATVADNTKAGNATSGTASAVANVVNIIDSAISSGHSFLGVININGNLNGNILLPANFVNQLLAANVPTVNIISNSGSGSKNTINGNNSGATTITNTNNEGVTNNLNALATTGSANISNNTSAGSASTGSANTSITAFNLTGSNVIGNNDLLVFVNVAGGKWVGLIVNAPPGTTAAELGGGIVNGAINSNTTVNNSTNDKITNNINLATKSGNANVLDNTSAGNAVSGNANDAANLLNIENSTLSLSNWFGILFINVFGTWNGSVGYYNPTAILSSGAYPATGPSQKTISFVVSASGFNQSKPAFHPALIPGSSVNYYSVGNTPVASNRPDVFLASASNNNNDGSGLNAGIKSADSNTSTNAKSHIGLITIAVTVSLFALYLIGDWKYLGNRHRRSTAHSS